MGRKGVVYFHHSGWTRLCAAAAWGLVCLCIAAAPVLLAHSCAAGSALYLLFSRICHQNPDRSFALFGYPLAVCHRCSGIYAGLLLGCFSGFDFVARSVRRRRIWVVGAALPLALDALVPLAGIWANTWCTRFFSGLLFGIIAATLVVRGLAELVQDGIRQPSLFHATPTKGDTA